MKHFTKLISFLLVLFLMAAFISCSGTNSSTPDESAEEPHDVVFAAPEVDQGGGSYVIQKYIFKPDYTWDHHYVYRNGNDNVMSAGTYTGDPSKDGTLTIRVTKEFQYDKGKLVELEDPQSYSYTISNGKVTVGSFEYTRQ